MPTPRHHGGTFVQPISLVSPANSGLNKQAESSILGPGWCTEALNGVFDATGRLSSRKGWVNKSTSAASGSPLFEQITEYIRENGSSVIIAAGGSKLWTGLSTWTDITGTATVTVGNNWQFINFNDKVLGFQQGEQPIIYTGTGSFSDLTASAGTAPQGNCGLAAFGRVWAVHSDRQTIKYSSLLNETEWSGGTSGSIDMSSVWPNGMDEVISIAAYNGLFVVFGRNTIVIWQDPDGGPLGIDPSAMGVIDTIVGVGCKARDSVQQIDNGDILFLSESGVQSLGRLIQEKSNPIENVSLNVRDYLNSSADVETESKIRSVFSPEESFYLLSFPTSGKVFCFDTSGKMQDGTFRVTEWDHLLPYAMVRTKGGVTYFTLNTTGNKGKVGQYDGYSDPDGIYVFNYVSGWLDLGEDAAQYLKIAKNLNAIIFISSSASVGLKWNFDFTSDFNSTVKNFTGVGTNEWNVMEWGIGQWSGGLSLRTINIPMSGTGQYIRLGLQANINGSQVALQSMNLLVKVGRLA